MMSMIRRHVVSMLAMAALGVTLAGCTSFAPVYGDPASGGIASARFNFAPPSSRLEQLILNRLGVAFPAAAGPGDPVLSVSARGASVADALSDAIVVGEPDGRRVEATVTISQDDRTIFSATRFTDTTFQSGALRPTNLLSAQGAQEQAARSTAESLRAAILAGYRPQ